MMDTKPSKAFTDVEHLTAQIHATLGCKDPLTLVFIGYVLAAIRLFDKKQADYGPENIAEWSCMGVFIRMMDKFKRLKNLLFQKTPQGPVWSPRKAANEALMDSFVDLLNYSAIFQMCWYGDWPGIKPTEPKPGAFIAPSVFTGDPGL